MINGDDRLYVTVAFSRGRDGSVGILLPGYTNRIMVRADPQESGGHGLLHSALAALLSSEGIGEPRE